MEGQGKVLEWGSTCHIMNHYQGEMEKGARCWRGVNLIKGVTHKGLFQPSSVRDGGGGKVLEGSTSLRATCLSCIRERWRRGRGAGGGQPH